MKQKIVIKLCVHCSKCKTKAMNVAAIDGVISLAFDGDQLVVIGEGVDAVCLTKKLRKKVDYAEIVSVNEVKDKPPPQEKPPKNKEPDKEKEKEKESEVEIIRKIRCCCRSQSPTVVILDDYPHGCFIM